MEESSLVEVIVVRLGGTRYALPMESVAEVGRPPGLTRVPGLPAWVAGLGNWRGRVLAVLDLRPLLAGVAEPFDRRARLLVLFRDGVRVGLLTEGVDGTVQLDPEKVEPVPAHLSSESGSLLAGQLSDASGPIAVLDLVAVLRLSEALPRARRAG
ncbi:MAG: CheW protein [Frankiales bacterium]|nr:CheW protein [Frankiales bacterium]